MGRSLRHCLVIFCHFYWTYIGKVFPKWIWHHFASSGTGQIQFWRIKVPEISTLMILIFSCPSALYKIPNYFGNAKTFMVIFENIIFENWHATIRFSKLGDLEILKSWSLGVLESWHLETLKLWNLGILNHWKVKTLKLCNFESLELWNFGTLKLLNT